ncbi:hypothetical protein KHA80_04535 [Anaerobacillus sp. HL2]|nr:hypothetical protein KHA80_04535 [Anaerobacillus sp. HL2]
MNQHYQFYLVVMVLQNYNEDRGHQCNEDVIAIDRTDAKSIGSCLTCKSTKTFPISSPRRYEMGRRLLELQTFMMSSTW